MVSTQSSVVTRFRRCQTSDTSLSVVTEIATWGPQGRKKITNHGLAFGFNMNVKHAIGGFLFLSWAGTCLFVCHSARGRGVWQRHQAFLAGEAGFSCFQHTFGDEAFECYEQHLWAGQHGDVAGGNETSASGEDTFFGYPQKLVVTRPRILPFLSCTSVIPIINSRSVSLDVPCCRSQRSTSQLSSTCPPIRIGILSAPISMLSIPTALLTTPRALLSAPTALLSVPIALLSVPTALLSTPLALLFVPTAVLSVPTASWAQLCDCLTPANVLVLRTAGPKWYDAKLCGLVLPVEKERHGPSAGMAQSAELRLRVVRTRTTTRPDLRRKGKVAGCGPMKTIPTSIQVTHVCPRVPVRDVMLTAESAAG